MRQRVSELFELVTTTLASNERKRGQLLHLREILQELQRNPKRERLLVLSDEVHDLEPCPEAIKLRAQLIQELNERLTVGSYA